MTQLQKITLAHRDYVEDFTRRHFPYSDFNFTSLWSWDIESRMRIGELHGNLVVRFTDYMTGEPFYSFLGDSNATETALELLRHSKEEGIEPVLRLMPECSVTGLDPEIFNVTEDEDHFDYVYDIDEHTKCAGKKFGDHRHKINRFTAEYASKAPFMIEIQVRPAEEAAETIAMVNKRWSLNKAADEADTKNEASAIDRMFQAAGGKLLVFSLSCKGYPIAYWVIEHVSDEYALAHFGKADSSFVGANPYLMKAMCGTLASDSKKLLNCEQDLGIPGLKQAKSSLRPTHFLKKYRVSLR